MSSIEFPGLSAQKSGAFMSFVSGRARLWLPLMSIGLLIVVGILLWALMLVNPIVGSFRGIDDDRPKLNLLRTAQFENLQANSALRNAVAHPESLREGTDLKAYQLHRQQATNALLSLRELGVVEDGQKRLNGLTREYTALEQVRDNIIDQWQSDAASDASRIPALDQLLNAENKYIAASDQLRSFEKARFDAYLESSGTNAVRVRMLMTLAGVAGGITLLLLGLIWAAELRGELGRRDARIEELREQRSALIREVHHRIKNHLQGLLGLIEGYTKDKASDGSGMATLQGHVLALVGIHGLQAKQLDESVMLVELLQSQIHLIKAGFPGAQILLSVDKSFEALPVKGERAVTLALTITELIVNAIKHGSAEPVHVALMRRDDHIRIAISNDLPKATKLDWNLGAGLGTGLSLVSSLVRDLGRITQEVREGRITMTLDLLPALAS